MKRLFSYLIIIILISQHSITAFAVTDNNRYDNSLYYLDEEKNVFYNYVDGYSLSVDKDLDVDMSNSSVYAVLENNNKRIEIFKQPLNSVGKAGYINYSNKFIENNIDHKLEFLGTQNINGKAVNITAWKRDKLLGIENDKNHYIVLDIVEGNFAYTIFVKANQPISNVGGYVYLVNNFKTFEPTMMPVINKTNKIQLENRGWSQETNRFYLKYFSDESDLTWGIFEPTTAMFDYKTLDYFEGYINYEFPIILNYSEFENKYQHPNLKSRLDTAYENGKTLELTLQTNWKKDSNGNMVYDILKGEYDSFLYDYAMTIKEFGHPVLFRLGNEMNGDWCPYSSYHTSRDPMIFKEFYRYVYSFFDEVGADNVIWVWNPNAESFPDFKWNHTLMYYPGDEYVDVVGLTAYNTGTYYEKTGEKWQEFNELYYSLYNEYVKAFGQPLMISEFASSNTGGDKTNWVINMFNNLKYYPKIKVAIWWDGADWDKDGNIARSYYIDDPISVLDVFKKYLKDFWKRSSYA